MPEGARILGRSWLTDPEYLILTALAGVGLFLPRPALVLGVWHLAGLALAEEVLFRWGLQEWLGHRLPVRLRLGPLTPANAAASLVFALAHLLAHAPLWALATFIPSLALGRVWDRHKSLAACALTHFLYNLALFHGPDPWRMFWT